MKRPICPLCGVALQHEYSNDKDGNPVLIEKHVVVNIHNPRNLHEDIKVFVHETCYNKVKAMYPKFDEPTQDDWASPKIPTIGNDNIVRLSPLNVDVLEKAKEIVM